MEAVAKDFGKPKVEAFQGEIVPVVTEIDHMLAHLKEWAASEDVAMPFTLKPGKQVIHKQPKGVALIIAPFNYPINLAIAPLACAISAGCACVLKPSEMTPHSAKIIEEIVNQYLDTKMYRVVQGAVAETTALLKQPWNHIFYTGNGVVGRIVYRAAAEHLCSVTLELGGKSPVFVAKDANVRVAARRILGTKCFNLGQTCVAPDYVMVDNDVKEEFIQELQKHANQWYGQDPKSSKDLARLVNVRHFDRVANMLKENHGGKVVQGGLEKADRETRFMPPTIVVDPKLNSIMMQEEIFGSVLPVVGVSGLDEALTIINSKEPSLASYVYTESDEVSDKFIKYTTSGGSCVNECILHISTDAPFGGAGASGLGYYHGKSGFDEFTFKRSTMTHSTMMDADARYAPYKPDNIWILEKLLIGPIFPPHVVMAMKVAAGVATVALLKAKL